MKILSQSDLNAIEFKQNKGKDTKANAFYTRIAGLSTGEGLLIEKSEWPLKSSPSQSNIPRRFRPSGSAYTVRTTSGDNAWVVIRAK